jgi:hypothetical protein
VLHDGELTPQKLSENDLVPGTRFYHSKGFLCDGDEFLGDWESTPTFGAGDRIGVRVDLARKSLVFTSNGKRVPGEISGVESKVHTCVNTC